MDIPDVDTTEAKRYDRRNYRTVLLELTPVSYFLARPCSYNVPNI